MENKDSCFVIVHNDYQFIPNQRYGRMILIIDRKRKFSIEQGKSIKVELEPNVEYVLRVMLFQSYRSNEMRINLPPGKNVTLRANIELNIPVVRRMLRTFFRPGRAILLRES